MTGLIFYCNIMWNGPLQNYCSLVILCLSGLKLGRSFRILDAPHTFSSKEEIFDEFYPASNISRIKVSGKARHDWEVPLPDYKPGYFTHPSVIGQPWADSECAKEYKEKFNEVDGDLDRRRTSLGEYDIEKYTGRPLNPTGRTGLCGRGLLGRWGPNHHSSLIVSRWFRDQGKKVIMPSSKKPLIEFVAVKFYGEWGIPGGFIHPKETYMDRAQAEFIDEALNGANMTEKEYKSLAKHLSHIYDEHSHFVYQGYLKDNRNTDNAWIETRVSNIHDETGDDTIAFHLKPGDGAQDVKWLIAHRDMTINPIHKEFLKFVTNILDAHW